MSLPEGQKKQRRGGKAQTQMGGFRRRLPRLWKHLGAFCVRIRRPISCSSSGWQPASCIFPFLLGSQEPCGLQSEGRTPSLATLTNKESHTNAICCRLTVIFHLLCGVLPPGGQLTLLARPLVLVHISHGFVHSWNTPCLPLPRCNTSNATPSSSRSAK